MDEQNTNEAPAVIEDSKTIYFEPALKVGNVEFPSLTLTEPTLDQLKQAERFKGNEYEWIGELIRLTSKAPASIVGQIKLRKLRECGDFFASFKPETKTSSPT